MSGQPPHTILYKLSPAPLLSEGPNTHAAHLNHPPQRHPFDLLNRGILKLNGTIAQPQHSYYDEQFKKALNNLPGPAMVTLFLNYHLQHTPNAQALLNRLEQYILAWQPGNNTGPILLNPDKIEPVAAWLLHQKQQLPAVALKPNRPQQLPQVFTGAHFATFTNLLQTSGIAVKGRIERYGISKYAEAAYRIARDNNWLAGVERMHFCKLFALYYTGKPIAHSAISQVNLQQVKVVEQSLRSLLQK